MTNLVEATDLIYRDFLAFASGASITSPVLFGNEDSVNGVKPEEGDDPWYRVTYREAAGGRANLNGASGSRRYERLGFLAVQCFVPVKTGTQAVLTMAEDARDNFEDSRSSTSPNTILYLNADIRPQQPDGKWYPVLLEVAVEVTDFK